MNESSPAESGHTAPQRPRSGFRRVLAIAAVVLVAALAGAAITKAASGPRPFGHGWHGGFMGGPMSHTRIEDRADRMVRHLAVEIDATAEQQDKLRAMMKTAVNDVLPAREKAWTARMKARDILTQPTVDRAELEKLRTEQIALADSVSKRISQALADAAEVLTPEQRKKLNDHVPPMGGYWHGWRRG